MEFQLPSHMPIDVPPPDSLPSISLSLDWLTPDLPPSYQSLTYQPPPTTPLILFNHGLHMSQPTESITASKCIYDFTLSWPPSASPQSLNQGLQVNIFIHSIRWSPSASPHSIDSGLQVLLQFHPMSVFMYILKHSLTASPSTSSRSDCGCREIQVQWFWIEWHGEYIWQTTDSVDIISFPSHIIIQSKCTLYLSQQLVTLALPKISHIIPFHQIPTLLKPEKFFLMNSVWMRNRGIYMLFRLCSSPICCNIDSMYIFLEGSIMHPI